MFALGWSAPNVVAPGWVRTGTRGQVGNFEDDRQDVFHESDWRLLACSLERFGSKAVLFEHVARDRCAFALPRVHVTAQPMLDDLWNPGRPTLHQVVEHAPERAVRRNWAP